MITRDTVLSFLGMLVLFRTSNGLETDLTIEVGAGRQECFHQYITQGSNFEFEYQVIQGGELDINFVVSSPTGQVLRTELRAADSIFNHKAEIEGDYRFCLDNTFSRFSKKLVFFEIVTDTKDLNWGTYEDLDVDDTESVFEVKVEDFKSALDKVKDHLDRSQQIQNVLRVYEARDRSIQESNFERVNLISGINLFVLISVGLIQVYFIRSLFEDKNTGGKVLKTRT